MKKLAKLLAVVLLAVSAVLSVLVLLDDELMARRDYIEVDDDDCLSVLFSVISPHADCGLCRAALLGPPYRPRRKAQLE